MRSLSGTFVGSGSWVIAWVTIALAILSGPAAAATPPDPSEAATLERIDAFLQREMQDADIPGLAVAIVADDRVVHARGFGIADGAGRPVTADTPFQLASLSKAFTAVAIMQLVEQGSVDLDAPAQRYLPWFRIGTAEQAARITVRNLLHQTSGIPPTAYRSLLPDDAQDVGALERRIRGLANVVLSAEPGEHYEYGNPNYEVLGLIVQVVSGTPYDEYIARNIYEPLGMEHSHVLASDAFADGASEGFYRWFGLRTAPYRTAYPRATGPAGVSFSSANDMGRWAIFHLGGLRSSGVVDPKVLDELHRPAVQVDERHWYGMGWVVRPLWEELEDPPETGPITDPVPDLVEHGGSWDTAHTYIGLVPERKWGIVVLANVNDRTMLSRYYYVELGLLNLLSGNEPLVPRLFESPLVLYGKQIIVVLFALQLVALAWAARTLARVRLGTRPPTAVILVGLSAALLVDLAVLYLTLVFAPDAFDVTVTQIIRAAPDVGAIMPAMIMLALVWGPIRTVGLLLVALREARPRSARPVAG